MTENDGSAGPDRPAPVELGQLPSAVLIQQSAQGDRDAFKSLFDRHAPRLYAVALRLTRHPNLAADTVQECFMQVWQNARNYAHARGTPEAWMLGMTRFRALDLIRRAGPAGTLLDPPAAPSAEDLAALPDSEDARALRAGFARMDPTARQALLLTYVDGLAQPELAKRLRLPPWQARETMRTALELLRVSGETPRSAEEGKAALFALGALNAEEMRALRQAAERDVGLAADVAFWEGRLLPLSALAPPAAVPETIWPHLEGRLSRLAGGTATLQQVYSPKARHGKHRRPAATPALKVWRGTALALLATTLGLLAVLILRQPDHSQTAMVLPDQPGIGAWLIVLHDDGRVTAEARGALSRGLTHDFELWVDVPGSDRPFSLGLLPVNDTAELAGRHKLPPPPYRLLVTLEPKGGSPRGVPTGPSIFVGEVGKMSAAAGG